MPPRQQETQPEQKDQELEELLLAPEIAEIISLVRQNEALALVLQKLKLDHTTQAFERAEQLGQAFHGQLEKVPVETVLGNVQKAHDQCQDIIDTGEVQEETLIAIMELVWVYQRYEHPVTHLLEQVISKIEGTEDTKMFSSGLAAIKALIEQFTPHATIIVEKKGERKTTNFLDYDRNLEKDDWEIKEWIRGGKVVVIGSVYGGTHSQTERLVKTTGRRVVRMTTAQFNEQGLPKDTDMVFFETNQNPTLEFSPVKKIVKAARELEQRRGKKISVAADNTFTPVTVDLQGLDVDFIINSCTKYFNGESEDLGGSLSGKHSLVSQVKDFKDGERMTGGAIMGIATARNYLGNLKELPRRLLLQTRNMRALQGLAKEFGLNYACAEREGEKFMGTYKELRDPKLPKSISNGMITIDFGSLEKAEKFVDKMVEAKAGKCAVSLGATTTYFCIPATTTHSEMTDEELAAAGVTKGMVRISCGTEPDLPIKFKKVMQNMETTQ